MSDTLGIIGSGGIGTLHAEAASKAGWHIAAVCDVDSARVEALVQKHSGARAFTQVDDMLALPGAAAVVIAVPNALHKEIAIAAMRAGKDVLLEKPMAMSVAECDSILEERDRTKRILQLGFVCRCTPMADAARRLIQSQRLGNIYHAKASIYRRRGIPGLGRWFTTKSQSGGGVLIDLGVHLVDLVMHLTGYPQATRVSGSCTSRFGSPIDHYRFTSMWAGPVNAAGVFDVEDGACALIRFVNGMTLELNAAWAMNLPDGTLHDGIVLLGDRGGCAFDLWRNRVVFSSVQDDLLVDAKPQLPEGDLWMNGWVAQHRMFLESVTNRTAPQATGENGRAVQAILEAIYRSAAEEREVEVIA